MPVILHAVPPEERAVGADGKQKPFAIVDRPPPVEGEESLRFKRTSSGMRATGSFGRSRRQTSRTKTAPTKDDWNLTATDDMFRSYLAKQNDAEQEQQRSTVSSQPGSQNLIDPNSASPTKATIREGASKDKPREPTEVILRGFQPSRSYAAIDKYERIGGVICEDFPRTEFDNPSRDPAVLRNRPLTKEELRKANALAMGNHWVKVTFESLYAAERAIRASPQEIYAHWVYADYYQGVPLSPAEDYKIPVTDRRNPPPPPRRGGSYPATTATTTTNQTSNARPNPGMSATLPRSFTTNSNTRGPNASDLSSSAPPSEPARPRALSASGSGTVTQPTPDTHPDLFCRRIPTARRIQLLPAEQAVLPKPSFFSLLLASLGMATIFGGLEECNRLEDGTFDWDNSSWYWRIWWCLEWSTGSNFTGTRYGWADGPNEPNIGPDGTVYPPGYFPLKKRSAFDKRS